MKVVDLSHELSSILVDDKLKLSEVSERSILCYLFKPDPSTEWHIAHFISFPSHIGTHIEAPYHWRKNGKDIASIPLEWLIGPSIKLDLSYKGKGEAITVEDINRSLKRQIRQGDMIFIQTNHSKLWGTEQYWEESPYLTVEAAKYLVDKMVRVVGIDAPRLDYYKARGRNRYIIHEILHQNDILVIENMANLDQFKGEGTAFILPVKIYGIDAFPVRVIVIEED
ncbi:MAG: cyclase family protein [Candidatus Bathyarchaeia archaeon]